MTICIAAICDGGKHIVVATDRMFTAPPPINVEFETDEIKIENLAPACVALTAGSSAYAFEVVKAAQDQLAGSQAPATEHVAEVVRSAYEKVRSIKVHETLLIPHLGPDFLRVVAIGTTLPSYLQAQPNLYMNLVQAMNGFNLGAEIIVAGVDAAGARLAVIGNPGTMMWADKLGHAAIGSGAIHAATRLNLGAQTRRSHLAETLYRVYEAKKAAEVAPGVGNATDCAIISPGKTELCSTSVLKALEGVFTKAKGSAPETLQPIEDALKAG
jgi:hypothetical protein